MEEPQKWGYLHFSFQFFLAYKTFSTAQAFGTVVNLCLMGPNLSYLCLSCPDKLKIHLVPSWQTQESLRTTSHNQLFSPLPCLSFPPPEMKNFCLILLNPCTGPSLLFLISFFGIMGLPPTSLPDYFSCDPNHRQSAVTTTSSQPQGPCLPCALLTFAVAVLKWL